MKRILLFLWLILNLEGAALSQEVDTNPSIDIEDSVTSQASDESGGPELVSPAELTTTRTYQEKPVTSRGFNKETWKKIVGDTDFKEEDIEVSPPSVSLPWAAPLLKVISYVVIGGVVLLLLYIVFRNLNLDFRIRRSEVPEADAEQEVEDIEQLDIDLLLARARASGNFRAAVRFYYLGLLKKLDARRVIAWKKDKTNRDYLAELFAGDFHYSEIKSLTFSYEAVWYGDHALQAEGFQRIADRFESIYHKIETQRV